MKEAIYSSYYCIGLMKLNEALDFFDSQIQCFHVLMDDEGKNVVEIDHPEKEYATFGDAGELFDLLAATFAVNHDVNQEIIRLLLSSAFEKEDDYMLPKGSILLGVNANSMDDLDEPIAEGMIGIMIQTISDEEFEIKDNTVFVQGKQCATISEIMETCNWNGMPTVAFHIN
jgi:hypothetical protein